MNQLTELQMAKDFIELSIFLNPNRQFLLPNYEKENTSLKMLYKAIHELKKAGYININLSVNGDIFITLNNK